MDRCPVSGESQREETFNFATHLFGFILSIVGFLYLLYAANSTMALITSVIYGTTLVALYGASTFYHSCKVLEKKHILKVVDHACIYLLIAGSYTPFSLGPLQESGGFNLLMIEWIIAIVGIIMKIIAIHRFHFISLIAYLAMGWLVMFSFNDLRNTLSMDSIIWLIAGGVIYSLGTLFYIWDNLPFNHGIWHLFVLGGSACHYISILMIVANN